MKRLGVYACIAILTISFFGNFAAPKIVVAQTTPAATTAGSYDYFYDKGVLVFTNTLNSLRQLRTTTAGRTSSTAQQLTLSQIDEKIGLITATQAAYTQAFNVSRQSGATPAATQLAAVSAGRARYASEIIRLSSGAQSEPLSNSIINRVFNFTFNSLGVEASQIQAGILQAGSAAAQALGSAAPLVTAGNTASNVAAQQDTRCFNFTSFSVANCVTAFVTWLIKNTLLEIAGFLLWLAANMFNYSVQIGILQFAQWAPDTLYPMWLIVRQVLSLIIVFIGLYLGFMYILGKDEKFARYVPFVVMFALFVNFSYPIARTAIDVSNIVSLNIYASAVGNNAIASSDPNNTAGAIIMGRLGLAGLATSATAAGVNGTGGIIGDINSIPGALLVVVFVLYAAYIFFMVTGIIVMRTAALVFLTVASPLLLIDSVLPFLGEKAMQIRKIFFEQLIVGPIFMIMLAITMRMLSIFSTSGALSQNGLGNLASNSQSTVVTFFNVVMMLIMLHIMITVTKKTAGALGEYATGAMGKIGGVGLGVAAGGAGLLARKGIGGLAMKARESSWVQNNKDSMLGRSAYSMSNSLANSSFDLRNSKVVAGKMSKLGMGMGMGRTMGYEEHAKKRSEEVQKMGETAGARHKEDVLDAAGNVIHKKGDFTEGGRLAYSRYNETLGGRSIFMSKEQKEKTKELLKENVTKNMAKEEAEIKKRAEELSKDYNVVGSRSEDLNKTKEQLKKEKTTAFDTMNADLDKLRKSDPTLRGSEAQALSAAINIIKDKKEEEAMVLNKKISDTVARYKKINVGDTDAVSRQNKIIDNLDATEQELFKEHLADPNKSYNTKPTEALTGDALRQQRLQKVSDGRARKVNFEEGNVADIKENMQESSEYKKEWNEIYDKEIADLENNAPNSLILDANGRPIKTGPSQAQINEVESKRAAKLKRIDDVDAEAQELIKEGREAAKIASAKQQASAVRAVKFSGGSSSSLDLDLSTPAQVGDVHNENFEAKIAAKRQAALARGAAAANAEMRENGTPNPSTGTSTPSPTTPSIPPSAPGGATAANETPYDQRGAVATKDLLAA